MCFLVLGLVAKHLGVGGPVGGPCRQICSKKQLAYRILSPTIAKGPKHKKTLLASWLALPTFHSTGIWSVNLVCLKR